MRFTSLTSRFLVVLAVLSSIAFSGDANDISFYLTSERIFAPGSPDIGVQLSGRGINGLTLAFRAFRVDNPVEFFIAQKDPHSPTLAALDPPNTFEMIQEGASKVARDARYAARDVMPADARRAIRDVADLNSTKAAARDSAKAGSAAKKKTPTASDISPDVPKGAERYEMVAQWKYTVQSKNGRDWVYSSAPAPLKEKGVYLVEGRARGVSALTVVVISELGMIVKQANGIALAFVVDRKSGEKVAAFPLTVARGGKLIAEKSTDGDGLLQVSIPPPEPQPKSDTDDDDEWRWEQRFRQVLVVGERDGNFVISDPYFYESSREEATKVYLHTDRPVYRPAQTVYYRAIVRGIAPDGTYRDAAENTVRVEVTDPQDVVVKRDTLQLSDVGTISGSLTLGDEPPLGEYSIRVMLGRSFEDWFNFSVEEYKKPEYKVEVTTDRQNYTRGDQIHATVKAQYFFGSPVTNAQVEYFVYRARYWRPWWRGSAWSYLYEDGDDFATYRMEMVHSADTVLGPDGTLTINYTTSPTADQDYVYRIQANVVDNSRRSISGAKSVEVTRGEFYLSTRTDKYVYRPGDVAKVLVESATFDGDRPVATPLAVRVMRTWWDPIRVADRTEYRRRSEQIWTGTGATGADGKGTVAWTTDRAGYFEIQLAATDARGTKITESSYIYVADNSYANWYQEGSGDVRIIPDKSAYTPGETMSALVVMPAPQIDALISVEGATLYSSHVERLTSNSAVIHVPIEDRFAPVFYVGASAIVNDQLYTESQRVTVVPKGKLINLQVTTDKAIYRPGAKGRVTVRAVDESGAPVPNADVAVGMVDEAVYSIMPDATPDIQRYFYGNRWNEVSTTSSLEFEFYGDTRRIPGADALYGAAAPASEAAPSLAARDGARTLAYGDVKGEMFVQPTVRRNFKDLMFWTPSARTGPDGTAVLDVDFPDNLTTWRITARGVTRETAVGQATARVIARKDLLVRMETPRFMVQGDELVIATTIHNYLSTEKTTKVQMAGSNIDLAGTERTISIPANGEERIDWKIVAPKSGSATLTVKALTNEESDAMELTVPVLSRGLKIITGASTVVDDASETMRVTLPEQTDEAAGDLAVTVAPSLAGPLLGALDELIGYPYGCVEQTMSRFLPTVIVAGALDQLQLPFDPRRKAQIPLMVQKGLAKLYGMQHQDGGWGWWVNDKSDPFMTAYVLYGLNAAQRYGFTIDQTRMEQGVQALSERLLGDAKIEATSEAYALYVLSLMREGAADRALVGRIASMARRDTINNYARALMVLASRNVGQAAQATALLGNLEKRGTQAPGATYWSGKSWHYNWQDDNVETTAMAVQAILALRGETEQVRGAVRWLLSQRQGDAWMNTRQTAMVIYALTGYLAQSKELNPQYTWTATLNGRQIGSGSVDRSQVFGSGTTLRVSRGDLRPGANVIEITKNGAGRIYAGSRMTYFATGPAIRPTTSGIGVRREYWLLQKQRRGDIYVYEKRPFNGSLTTGDELFVKVTTRPAAAYDYFMLEDPLPAGCEVVLNTAGYTIPGEPEYDEQARRKRGIWDSMWYWWFTHREIRDEKIAFFADHVAAEDLAFTYVIRAQIPGRYTVMPSAASLMYYPEVRGNGAPQMLTITP